MQKLELAQNKLKQYNQEEILSLLDRLDENEKEELINQVLKIDFEEIKKLYENINKKENKEETVTPAESIDKELLNENEKNTLEEIGLKIIKQNKYAVVTMAGGQGTRLGWNGPKGTYKLANGKYIFEILAEKFKDFENQYGIYPNWYIMTSEQNNKQTIEFFDKMNYFGLDKSKVEFFKQDEIPVLTSEGKLVIENNKIKTASNGNGAVYDALIKEHIIDDMKSKGIEWIYISGVDNIMVNYIDPLFLGLTVKNNMQIASKSVIKGYPEEKVGVFCKKNGRPAIIEYVELTEEMRYSKKPNGDLVYGDANIISHLLNVNIIKQITEQKLQYHLEVKNGLYKFEAFIFDGFKAMEDMLIMRVKREEEFAPIKNKEGIDSAESALEIYEKNNEKNMV